MIISPDTIEFENIDDLCVFVRFNPKNKKSVLAGYILSEDVLNDKQGILYAKDTQLDAARISQLKRVIENNPDTTPKIVINLNDSVIKYEKVKMLAALNQLIESKARRPVYAKFMSTVKSTLEAHINDILSDQDIVLYISKLKFFEAKTRKTKINPFYNHMLNTLIFSIGIMSNLRQLTHEEYSQEEVAELGLVALLHGAGGWQTCVQYLDFTIEERRKKYIEANAKNYANLKQYKLSGDILDAIEFCYDFQNDDLRFLQKNTKAAKYAKIVSVASAFDDAIAGFWTPAKTPREFTDQLYVKTHADKMEKVYVDALAKGLKFSKLFNFYHELDVLNNSCKRNSGKAYPLTGFKSPVIYVCRYNLQECKEFVATAKSITVFKEMAGLEEGSYGRCIGLSERLSQFYDKHYKDIKAEVIEKESRSSRGE